MTPYYTNNVDVLKNNTRMVRGNRVSDLSGENVTGIEISDCDTLRMKDNVVVRMRSNGGTSKGFDISKCKDALLVYNVASRCDLGFDIDVDALSIYNITVHNCTDHIRINVDGTVTVRNACLSVYEDHKSYKVADGFILGSVSTEIDADYVVYYGLDNLYNGVGIFTLGDNNSTDKPLYMDEANDDLIPDHISILVNSGTDNPLHTESPDIGGMESEITDETTADRNYHLDLLDNTFWDVDNDQSAEVSFIKTLQSRILANSEVALSSAKRDYYIKQMDSSLGFSELFPMRSVYANASKFKKRVQDMWYATQNAATEQALQNAIGGYNRFPSFFKRLEDYDDVWVLGQSAIGIDNTLLGYEGLKYGIMIDVLGTSTMSTATSGEAYDNVGNCIADMAPTKWALHHEPQPDQYFLFADMYNDYEQCVLTNMIYNDDFAIGPELVDQCQCLTPLLPTGVISTLGPAPSGGGDIEISLLDRIYSEAIDRTIYYRQGASFDSMGAWTEIEDWIGGSLSLTEEYVQFRIGVSGILRTGDYEFVGLCLRPYSTARDWTQRQPLGDPWISLPAGSAAKDSSSPPIDVGAGIVFPNDEVEHRCGWSIPLPPGFVGGTSQVLRFVFAHRTLTLEGVAIVNFSIDLIQEPIPGSGIPLSSSITKTDAKSIQVVVGETSYIDVDISDIITTARELIGEDQIIMVFSVDRDSSIVGDTLAGDLMFIFGHSVEE